MALQSISDQEIRVVTQSASNSYVYPLTWFEQQVLDCIDPASGAVNTIEGANRLMQLMKSTKTVCNSFVVLMSRLESVICS